jgi:hypothetical protein
MVIMAGKYVSEEWFKEEHPLIIVISDKGWTFNKINLI